MREWAKRARGQRDSKVKQLVAWLNQNLKPGGKWSKERVIIFTEYRPTQNWLQEVLSAEGFTEGDRLLTMYGGTRNIIDQQLAAEIDRLRNLRNGVAHGHSASTNALTEDDIASVRKTTGRLEKVLSGLPAKVGDS
jgi:ERCC4-related helicase